MSLWRIIFGEEAFWRSWLREEKAPAELASAESRKVIPAPVSVLSNSAPLAEADLDMSQRTKEDLDALIAVLGMQQVTSEKLPLARRAGNRFLQEASSQQADSRLAELRKDTLRSLDNIQQAPAMANLAQSFVHLTSQATVDLDEVVSVVEKDPAIAARILRMSNSALVSSATPIDDLRTAVAMLGLQRVKLTAQVMTTMQESRSLVEGVNWKHLWVHCFSCALLCSETNKLLQLRLPDHVYLAGLMHDLGKILLSCVNPVEYRQLLIEATVDHASLLQLELEHFGLTHEEAGAVFARKNRFPAAVIDAMGHHSTPGLADAEPQLAAVVNIANYLAKAYGLGFSGSPLSDVDSSLEETPGWQFLQDKGLLVMDAQRFQTELRPYLSSLRKEMHEWLSGRRS